MVILQATHINTRFITTYKVVASPQSHQYELHVNFVNNEKVILYYSDSKVFDDLKKIDSDFQREVKK